MKTPEQISKILKSNPRKQDLAASPSGGNRVYIPIDRIEALLDQIYDWDGWQIVEFSYTVVINEMVGNIVLEVWSDRRGQWVRRIGTASVMITTKAGAEVLDVSSKIKNAMEKMQPSLLSRCLSNATKGLGKRFGRGINRSEREDYTDWEMKQDFNNFQAALPLMQSQLEVNQAFNDLFTDVKNHPEIKRAYVAKIAELEEIAKLELPPHDDGEFQTPADLFSQQIETEKDNG